MVVTSPGTIVEVRVIEWVKALPDGIATLSIADEPPERVMRITPTRPEAAEIDVRVASYGGFGVYAGKGFAVDESKDVSLLVGVLDAISRGGLSEKTKWVGRYMVSARAVLEMPAGTVRSSFTKIWLPLFAVRTQEVRYSAWK